MKLPKFEFISERSIQDVRWLEDMKAPVEVIIRNQTKTIKSQNLKMKVML